MRIRLAEKTDIDGIMAVEEASFIPAIREERNVFLDRINTFQHGFLILEKEGKLAGYFCGELWNSVPGNNKVFALGHSASQTHCNEGCVLYISSFAISPRYRGLGLGTPFFCGCLRFIAKEFPKIKTLLLLVNEEWLSARHIYESIGFKVIRVIPGFFPSEVNAGGSSGILMQSELLV